MAPKKPPDKKPEKDEKKPEEEEEEGLLNPLDALSALKPWQIKMMQFFESFYSLYVGAVLVVASVVGSIMLTYLYIKEVQRRAIFEEGTTKIVQLIEDSYPELFDADDITKFKKAENISAAITEEKRKIHEVEQAINDIHNKLREEWVIWHGSLYLFDMISTPRTWKMCVRYCERMKYETKLICIENDEEEAFVVSNVLNKPTDYYIGYRMGASDWVCYQKGSKPLKRTYWDYPAPHNKGPGTGGTTNCVFINRGCKKSYNCWRDAVCQNLKRCICKRKPMEKWMK